MSETLERFEIWTEGYQATGQGGTACYFGACKARNFKEACDIFFARRPTGFYDPVRMTHWGCRLFDNEQDARKSFG